MAANTPPALPVWYWVSARVPEPGASVTVRMGGTGCGVVASLTATQLLSTPVVVLPVAVRQAAFDAADGFTMAPVPLAALPVKGWSNSTVATASAVPVAVTPRATASTAISMTLTGLRAR